MQRTIQYGVDLETGLVVSRCGGDIAIPVLKNYPTLPEEAYKTRYGLEAFCVHMIDVSRMQIKWTRKLPVEIKNVHRKFWGFKPLKGE